jgi:hypothetical protein
MVKKKTTKKAVTKKKVARKKSVPKKKMEACSTSSDKNIGLVKLSSMAFILFLITVWPSAMNLFLGIHWGWYLGAWIIFGALACKKMCCK